MWGHWYEVIKYGVIGMRSSMWGQTMHQCEEGPCIKICGHITEY